MNHVLVVEDNRSDLRQSTAVLKKLQFSQVEAVATVESALMLLQDAVEGDKPAPDLVLLDLSFALDSGFEVLRYWKSHQDHLKNTRIVVWTIMGETEQELCRYFGVDVVPKWAGTAELENVLQEYKRSPAQAAE
jgi:CheY-like chemotaxis protein